MATVAIVGGIAFLLWLGVLIKCMLDERKEKE